jgi:DNA-binding FrmR family transcriptional regulator
MEHAKTTVRDESLKTDLMTRLKRIEGQVKGVTRMVEQDVYCDNILHQISAIRAALDGVGRQVLENHLRGCLVDRIQAGENEVVDELLVTIKTLLK